MLFGQLYSTNSKYNQVELYKKIIDYYNSLSQEEKSQIDISQLEKKFLYDIANGDIEFDIINDYCNIVNQNFRETLKNAMRKCHSSKCLCDYLEYISLDEETFINFSVRAIGYVLPDDQVQIESIEKLKKNLRKGFI